MSDITDIRWPPAKGKMSVVPHGYTIVGPIETVFALEARSAELESLVKSQAERIAQQAELLAKRAEK